METIEHKQQSFACPSCQHLMAITPEHYGVVGPCPKCRKVIQAPDMVRKIPARLFETVEPIVQRKVESVVQRQPVVTNDQISFGCHACSHWMVVPGNLAGVSGPCPKCRVTVTAPRLPSPAPATENKNFPVPQIQIPLKKKALVNSASSQVSESLPARRTSGELPFREISPKVPTSEMPQEGERRKVRKRRRVPNPDPTPAAETSQKEAREVSVIDISSPKFPMEGPPPGRSRWPWVVLALAALVIVGLFYWIPKHRSQAAEPEQIENIADEIALYEVSEQVRYEKATEDARKVVIDYLESDSPEIFKSYLVQDFYLDIAMRDVFARYPKKSTSMEHARIEVRVVDGKRLRSKDDFLMALNVQTLDQPMGFPVLVEAGASFARIRWFAMMQFRHDLLPYFTKTDWFSEIAFYVQVINVKAGDSFEFKPIELLVKSPRGSAEQPVSVWLDPNQAYAAEFLDFYQSEPRWDGRALVDLAMSDDGERILVNGIKQYNWGSL